MTTLSNAKIIDPVGDRIFIGGLTIQDGKIAEVFEGSRDGEDMGGAYLAPGIVDIGVKIGEPGERHKESFKTASAAALAGGVTRILMRADTDDAIDNPETLAYARARATQNARIHVHNAAAITRNRAGLEMAEIGFLRDAGAIAFSDGDAVITDTKIALRAYQYIHMMQGMVIGHIQEPFLSQGSVVTSGTFATKQGLAGASPMAEKLGLQREMALVEMSGVRYHIDQVTTECALAVLERAKSSGLPVTAGTSIHHITLNEFDIGDYRTFFKLKPPLRSEDDRLSMVKALREGLIDCISSMHTPQDEESKRLPFDEAAAGAVALETLLPAALRLVHDGSLELTALFRALSTNPSNILGLDCGRIEPGAPADLIVFDADRPWVLDRFQLHSKAKNTPFDGARLQGRVMRTYVNGECRFMETK